MLGHVALVRTYVSEERNASIIRVTRIRELGIALAVTNALCEQMLYEDGSVILECRTAVGRKGKGSR
jgi:hypothetical protein